MVVLLWLTPLFYYLPYATLAAVIMVSVLGLLDFKKMWGTWRINRNEGLVTVITFTLTLVLAPRLTNALALGTLLSLGVYLYETMRPRFTELTRNEEGELVEIDKPELRKMCQLVSLVRFNGSLYFGSASYFEEKILQLIAQKRKLRWIVLDCVSINKLDASGLDALRSVCAQLEEAGIAFWFARARPPVLSVIKSGGLYAKLGDGHFYKNNEAALQALAYLLGEKHMSTCPLAKK